MAISEIPRSMQLATLVMLIACLTGTSAHCEPQLSAEKELRKTGVTRIKDGVVSAFSLAAGPHSVILIDAGYDPNGVAILSALAKQNAKPEDVTEILITHAHADHVAAIDKFPNATVYAFASATEIGLGAGAKLKRLRDGQILKLRGKKVHVFAMPGHTKDGAAFVVDDVLFLGDAAVVDAESKKLKATSWIFVGAERQADTEQLIYKSLSALFHRLQTEGVSIHIIAPAHSDPMVGADIVIK